MKAPLVRKLGLWLLSIIGLYTAIVLLQVFTQSNPLSGLGVDPNSSPFPGSVRLFFFALGVGLWVALLIYTRHALRLHGERAFVLLISTSFFLLGHLLINLVQLMKFEGRELTVLSGISCGIILAGVVSILISMRNPEKESPKQAAGEETHIRPQISDFIALTKPVIVVLLLVTTLAAMIVAAGRLPPASLILWTMLGGGLTAAGSSALNQVIDRDADQKMQRTRRRPLAEGRLRDVHAISFGLALCILGFYILAIFVNILAALLALAGILYYVVFYSLYLKYSTPQNIVIGGGAGAIPPLVGWAAVTASLSIPAFFLFALVFFWTPPHFWALALVKERDYARAGVPMLPVVHGEKVTRSQIFLYSIQLVALTLLLPLANLGSWLFLIAAVTLGVGLMTYAWRLLRTGGNATAWRMYRYSSMYLALIFGALVVDTLVVG
jgi:protoheme IX farnesyltransferase